MASRNLPPSVTPSSARTETEQHPALLDQNQVKSDHGPVWQRLLLLDMAVRSEAS
jgi:hypothetical protein